MKCPKCNKVYSEDNVFCVNCGTRLINEENNLKPETPIERFSTRVKTSKPKEVPKSKEIPKSKGESEFRRAVPEDNKLDILILQNRELIKQNNKIIELLEKLVN